MIMTVQELIDALNEFDRDRVVIVAKDPEGNGYSPLSDLHNAAYEAETTYSGNIGLEELTAEDIAAGYSEEDIVEDGEPCVVLWPIN